jgi:hypothetical protein
VTEARSRRHAPAQSAAMQWLTEVLRRGESGSVATLPAVERRRDRSDGEGRSDTRAALSGWRL